MAEREVTGFYERRFERRVEGYWGKVTTETEATHLCIQIRHGQDSWRTEAVFRWPEQRLDADVLERMLAIAFSHGQSAARKEIQKVLGISA